MLSGGRCVCAGNTALAAAEDKCIVPSADSDCKRRAKVDGVQTCITEDVCSGGLKLAQDGDGFTCVSECESGKHEEDDASKELRCVQDCAHWWYAADDTGLCKASGWLKSTVIVVPIVVVVVVIVVVTCCIVAKKKKAKASVKTNAKMKSIKRPDVTGEF